MANKTINFGIIGCGRVFLKHAESVMQLKNAKLVGVCDIKTDRLEAAKKKYNCKGYEDYKEMVLQSDIDVVSICTPSGLHAEMTIKAAKAGKHVIVEKPMAMNLHEADEMIEECKQNNVKLFVVKQNRYNEPIKRLKGALDEKRFGQLFYGNVTVYWSRPQEYYDQDPWRGTKAIDGGVLMNQSSHHIDMIRWLMGEVKSVKAYTDTLTHDIESEDMGIVILKFKNGAVGSIVATTSVFPHNIEGSVTIMGTKGTVKVGGVALNKMEIWKFKDWKNEDELISESSENPPNVYGFGHFHYIKDAVESIQKNMPPKIDGKEGRKTLELITRIYQSAKSDKEKEIKL
tara:strand:+ start:6664 stop:7695 length:1032 start_codon:yes stop_codon:yes gene_type:complete